MLKQQLLILILLILAGCAQRRDQDMKASQAESKGGLFFLTDSLQGQLVREDIRLNNKGYAFIQQDPIITLGEVELGFFYDTVIAADTFALVAFQLKDSALQRWRSRTADTPRKKVGLVVGDELIHWFPLNAGGYPAMQICYCDYSRQEIMALEQKLKQASH
jgi:hypothetical protein